MGKTGGNRNRPHKNLTGKVTTGQGDLVEEEKNPEEIEPWRRPDVLQGDWQGQTLDQTPKYPEFNHCTCDSPLTPPHEGH